MSYEVPSDERRDRKTRIEIDKNRNLAKFSPTYSTQVSEASIGSAVGGSAATGVRLGSFVMNPELHTVCIELSWTSGTGDLKIGDLVDTDFNAWQGKFLHLTSGTSTAGRGVFEPQNTTVFSGGDAQVLSVSGGWSATYTTGTDDNDRIVMQSASAIVQDITGANPTISTILGVKNDGQFTTIKPIETKTLTMTSGGNIDTSVNVTVEDDTYSILQFFEDNITPDDDGSWSISSASGGSSNIDDGTAENDHLEWDDTGSVWVAQQFLEFGSGNHPAVGDLRFRNNVIGLAFRNFANDGDVEIKLDTNDFLDITENNNGIFNLRLRSQHAVDPDNELLFTVGSGTGGVISITSNLNFSLDIGASSIVSVKTTGISMNDLNIEDVTEIHGRDDATPFKIVFDQAEDADTFISDDSATADRINVTVGGTTIFSWLFDGADNIFGVPTGITAELEMSTNDIKSVDRLTFSPTGNTGALDSALDAGIYLSPTDSMVFNVQSVDNFQWSLTDIVKLSLNDSPVLALTSDDAIQPIFELYENNPTPALGNIGAIDIEGQRTTGGKTSFVNIIGTITDFGSTTSEGGLDIFIRRLGVTPLEKFMSFNDLKDNQVKTFKDLTVTAETSGLPRILTIEGDLGGDELVPAQIIFKGDDAGGNKTEYALIKQRIKDPTEGVEKGSLEFEVLDGSGSPVKMMEVSGDNADFGTNFFERVTIATNQQLVMAGSFIEFDSSISNPGQTGIERKLFTHSTNSDHLSVVTPSGVIDLEVGGGGSTDTTIITGGGNTQTFATIVKTEDESVTSSTTLQDDDELFFIAKANTTYAIHLVLYVQQNGGQFDMSFTIPSGTSGQWTIENIVSNADGSTSSTGSLMAGIGVTHTVDNLASLVQDCITFEGKVDVGSTAGKVGLKWAQNISNGNASQIFKGSYIRVFEQGTQTSVGSGGTSVGAFAKIVKSADEAVTSSVTQQDDNELKFEASANKVYNLRLSLWWDSSAAGDIDTSWTVPSGATIRVTQTQFNSDGGQVTQDGTTEDFHDSGATTFNHNVFDAIVETGSTAGTVNFLWAQAVSDGTPTTVLKGSSLIVYEEGVQSAGGDAGESFIHTKVVKTTDESVTSSITLQNDDELFFTGVANKTYFFRLDLFQDVDVTPDLDVAWTLPTGATGSWTTGTYDSLGSLTGSTANITTEHLLAGNANDRHSIFSGVITMGSTTGVCNFQFAQNVSDAAASIIQAGSCLLVYEEGTQTISDTIEEGKFRIVFDQRGISTATNKTQASPLVLKKWQIILPTGLTETNQIGILAGNMLSYMRRVSGASTIRLSLLESDDGVTWDDFVFVNTSTDASFTRKSGFNNTTSLQESRRFLAVALYDTGGDSVGEAREIHFDTNVILPAGYNLVEV